MGEEVFFTSTTTTTTTTATSTTTTTTSTNFTIDVTAVQFPRLPRLNRDEN